MIINTHVHVNTDSNFFFYNSYNIDMFIKEMVENKISFSLPCLNPKINIFKCPNDCANNCMINKDFESNMQNCIGKCKFSNRHRTTIIDMPNNILRVQCNTCSTIIYEGIDPLHNLNILLLEQLTKYKNFIKPILYFSVSNSTLQNEIDFFEANYKGLYAGYKLHPWTNQRSVAKIKNIKTDLPFLIHTGLRYEESPKHAIEFSMQNDLKVVITHAAQLNKMFLSRIALNPNLYIDICPADFLFKYKHLTLEHPERINSPQDIYMSILDIIPSNKILFGSDSPWGNTAKELEIIESLKISNEDKQLILFKTALELYKI